MINSKNQNSGGKTRKNLKLVLMFLEGSKFMFALGIVFAALSALADMLTPQIIRITLDNVIAGKPGNYPDFVMRIINSVGGFEGLRDNLWIMAAAVLAVALINVICQYCFTVFNTKASETLIKTMRDKLFSHIGRLPYGWHMQNRTGDIIQRCTSDIDTMKNFVSGQLTSIFRIVILLVFSVVFMLRMNAGLTLIAMIPIPIIILYSVLFHGKIGAGFEKCDECSGRLSAMAQENLTGVRVVRAFGRERYEKDRFHDYNDYYTGLWKNLAEVMGRFWSTSDVLSGLQIMLIVVCGAVFCIKGNMSAGEYVAFISYNSMLVWPIRQLGRMISELSKAGVSVDRIRYIMETEPEHDRPGAICPPMTGDIVFDHVSFAYDGSKPVLEDVSFTVKGGTTLGILGGTGSGKSTLMLLLDKLYRLPPKCGRITVGGVDISDIQTDYLRKNIATVLQEPFLFSRTISENIGIALENAEDGRIRAAAADACFDEAVNMFTNGYDTFVGERGVTLSGGQKQRAAIARALTLDAPIMIFDDSLSAVDTQTDAKIRRSLERRFKKSSIILISHRITTLAHADLIVVLDHGKVVQAGTHEQLKAQDGIYRSIYEIQSSPEKEDRSNDR